MRNGSTLVVMRKSAGLLLLLLFFFLVVEFVNPLRQVLIQDDWSYALTVRHLLTTGEYKLHDWAAANMPVQIYWAGFLTQVFGYSFIVLRCSTLILLFTGLLALYRILRDFGVGEGESGLLTLTVLSSPAVLFLSFTFQTDYTVLGLAGSRLVALFTCSPAGELRLHGVSFTDSLCRGRDAAVRGSASGRSCYDLPYL